jgi:hypothetical protein
MLLASSVRSTRRFQGHAPQDAFRSGFRRDGSERPDAVLTLRPGQVQSFERTQEERFYSALAADLDSFAQSELPEIAPQDRESRIRHVFHVCAHYGIETCADITQLSYILLAFPPDFFQHQRYYWLHEILSSSEPASDRVARVTNILLDG